MTEKDTTRLLIFSGNGCSHRMSQWLEAPRVSLVEVGMRAQIPAWRLLAFFSFIVFLPLSFLLFILTADPFSFARFLRKRISSLLYIRVKLDERNTSSSSGDIRLQTLFYAHLRITVIMKCQVRGGSNGRVQGVRTPPPSR